MIMIFKFKKSPEHKNLMLFHGPKSKISSLVRDIPKVCHIFYENYPFQNMMPAYEMALFLKRHTLHT